MTYIVSDGALNWYYLHFHSRHFYHIRRFSPLTWSNQIKVYSNIAADNMLVCQFQVPHVISSTESPFNLNTAIIHHSAIGNRYRYILRKSLPSTIYNEIGIKLAQTCSRIAPPCIIQAHCLVHWCLRAQLRQTTATRWDVHGLRSINSRSISITPSTQHHLYQFTCWMCLTHCCS